MLFQQRKQLTQIVQLAHSWKNMIFLTNLEIVSNKEIAVVSMTDCQKKKVICISKPPLGYDKGPD